jgi:hypothetical protein
MYKVTFFPNTEEHTYIRFKTFETAEEAFKFAELRGEDILEVKKYDNKTDNTKN